MRGHYWSGGSRKLKRSEQIVPVQHEILTPEEAAHFLRLSRSTVYQRSDIPRHRMPGSRQIRFIRSELLDWIKGEPPIMTNTEERTVTEQQQLRVIDIGNGPVYHRNGRYR